MTGVPESPSAADYFVWIASSGHGGDGLFADPPEAAFAWRITTAAGERMSENSTALRRPVKDYHTAATLEAAIEALSQTPLPQGSGLHFVSHLKFFTDLLNEPRSIRRSRAYRKKSKPKESLAYPDKWQKIDDILDSLDPKSVTASLPWSIESRGTLGGVRHLADDARRKIGRRPDEWNL